MAPVDPFTYASPQYQAAMRTCDRTGPAFQVVSRAPLWYRVFKFAVPALAIVGALCVAFAALACLAVR